MAFDSKLLDGIVVFVEVVQSGSLTLAAQNTGHSTSYISKEIKQLEDRVGVRLLHRTTRSQSLTPEGELYFDQCLQIVSDAEQAETMVGGRQLEPKGTLKVSCPVSFGLSHIRPILAKFTEMYPQIVLDLELNDRKADMIAEGVDVVIRASAQAEDSTLISRRFMQSYGITLASPAYLARYGTPTHPLELANRSTIVYSYLKKFDTWVYKKAGEEDTPVKLNSRVITNSPEMILALCIAGQGIIRTPIFNIGDALETGELVELLSDYDRFPVDVCLVYPSRKHMSAKVRGFIDFIVEELGD